MTNQTQAGAKPAAKIASNPFSTALLGTGAGGLVLALMLGLVGYSQGLEGAGMLAVAGLAFPVGVGGMLAWLLLEGLRWKAPVAR